MSPKPPVAEHKGTPLPLRRIAMWGLALNFAWELGQCAVLYDMENWSFWWASAIMWAAIAGDVLIVLGVAGVALAVVGRDHLIPLDSVGWVGLLSIGFVASVGLEWAARALGFWGYTAVMPTLTVLGHSVGLSPIAQITLLPALSVYMAGRYPSQHQRFSGRQKQRSVDQTQSSSP